MIREKDGMSMQRNKAVLVLVLILIMFFAGGGEAAQYCATYSPAPLPNLEPGATAMVSVTVTNCGTVTWPANSDFRLAYHITQGSNQVLFDGVRTPLPTTVAQNGSVFLQGQVKAVNAANQPLAEGQYTVKWDMVREGVTWFSTQGNPTGDQPLTVKKKKLGVLYSPELIKKLCQILNCDGSVQPAIMGIWGKATPGIIVMITGKAFGVAKGMVEISGDFGKRQPDIVEWYDSMIGVKIPPDIVGVKDHPVSFVVRRASDNKESAPYMKDFYAARELVEVSGSGVGGSCSCNSDCDKCSHHNCGGCDAFIAGGTISGNHETHFPDYKGDSGTDQFTLTLKNGWLYYDRQCWGLSNPGPNFPAIIGSPYMSAKVNWATGVGEHVNYHCSVRAEGPKGVPYK